MHSPARIAKHGTTPELPGDLLRHPIDLPLPQGGRIFADRPLPFLCAHRRRDGHRDDVGGRLVTMQAAHLLASGNLEVFASLAALVDEISIAMARRFGKFVVLEIWTSQDVVEPAMQEPSAREPRFRVAAPDVRELRATIETLVADLEKITVHHQRADVELSTCDGPAPPGLDPLLSPGTERRFLVGIEIHPVYLQTKTGDVYPLVFENVRRQLGVALKRCFFRFAGELTTFNEPHFLALGRRTFEPAVSQVDEGLAQIGESLEFLLQATPVNANEAWTAFKESGFRIDPEFRYRPLRVDPGLLKRRLFELPFEGVEDPALSEIFREKREELDRKITMLQDRGSRQFFFESLQLYGEVQRDVLALAEDVLVRLLGPDYDLGSAENLDAEAFAEVAAAELARYRKDCPEFPKTVQIRRDMPPGLMVVRGRLLIGHATKIPAPRVEALLHHEIGTHILTYFNGKAQPLGLFYTGFARYDALQEGMAVLAEYLCGGLSAPRMRVLAARVVAAQRLIDGCSFAELYRHLRDAHAFEEHEAFSITMRTFRGGGMMKDVIYLRGFRDLLGYVRDHNDLEPLFVGKIALHHLPVVCELRLRGVLKAPRLFPRYLAGEPALDRLTRIRQGLTFVDLMEAERA